MRRWWLAGVLVACAGCAPKAIDPSGIWSVDAASRPESINNYLWASTRLRIRPDGTFRTYGALPGDGRYTTSGSNLRLIYSQTMNRGPVLGISEQTAIVPLDELVVTVGKNALTNMALGTKFPGSKWVRMQPPSIDEIFTQLVRGRFRVRDEETFLFDELSERGKEAVPYLAHVLDTSLNDRDCQQAAWMLGPGKQPEAIPPLTEALKRCAKYESKTKKERSSQLLLVAAISHSLGLLKARQAVPELIAYANAQDVGKWAAIRALGDIGDPSSAGYLTDLLRREKTGPPHPLVVAEAIGALGKLGDRNALPAILDWQTSKLPRIVVALSVVVPKLENDPSKAKPFVDVLVAELSGKEVRDDGEPFGKPQIAAALGNSGSQDAVDPLIKALDDSDHRVVQQAALALGKLHSKEALPKLALVIGHIQDRSVQAAAKEGTREILSYTATDRKAP